MVRHIKGGHVAFAMDSGTQIPFEQVQQAQKNAGESTYCQDCRTWIKGRHGVFLAHREQCKGVASG